MKLCFIIIIALFASNKLSSRLIESVEYILVGYFCGQYYCTERYRRSKWTLDMCLMLTRTHNMFKAKSIAINFGLAVWLDLNVYICFKFNVLHWWNIFYFCFYCWHRFLYTLLMLLLLLLLLLAIVSVSVLRLVMHVLFLPVFVAVVNSKYPSKTLTI